MLFISPHQFPSSQVQAAGLPEPLELPVVPDLVMLLASVAQVGALLVIMDGLL